MTAQEIQQNMTQGKWRFGVSAQPGTFAGRIMSGDWSISNVHRYIEPFKDTANAAAITTAVNNTYGKGLDPEQYMPLRNAAAALYAKFSKEVMTAEDFEELNNVLVKTIIEPNKVLK